MDYAARYKISNGKIIARLLPYWARGRRLFGLLLGSLKPLETLHTSFKSWAQQQLMETKIPFNRVGVEYVLTQELVSYFKDKSDSFSLGLIVLDGYPFIIDRYGEETKYGTNTHIYPVSHKTDGSYIYAILKNNKAARYRFNVLAPKLLDESKEKEYILAIQKVLAKYTIMRKYTIQIRG